MTAAVIASVSYDFDTRALERANREMERMQERLRQIEQGGGGGGGRPLSRLSRGARVAGGAITALGTAFVAATAAVVSWVAATEQARGEMRGLIESTGLLQKELQLLGFAGAQFGLTQDKINDQMKDLQDRIGDFITTGGGPLTDLFEALGNQTDLTAEKLQAMSGPDQLGAIAKAMREAGLSAQQTTFVWESLADEGSKLALVVPHIEAMKKRFKELNLETQQIDLKRLHQLDQSFRNARNSIGALVNRVMADMGPTLSRWFERVADIAANADETIATWGVTIDSVFGVLKERVDQADRFLFQGFFGNLDFNMKEANKAIINFTAGWLLFQKKQSEVIESVIRLTNGMREATQKGLKDLVNRLIAISDIMLSAIGTFSFAVLKEFINLFSDIGRLTKLFGKNFVKIMKAAISGDTESIKDVFSGFEVTVGTALDGVIGRIADQSSEKWEKDYLGSMLDSFKEFGTKILDLIKGTNLFKDLKAEYDDLVASLTSARDKLLEKDPVADVIQVQMEKVSELIKVGRNALKDYNKDMIETKDIWAATFKNMEDALTNFVMTGKLKFKDFIKSIIEMIIRSQIQQLISNVFGSFLGGGGNAAAAIGNAIPLAKGGAFNSNGVQFFANGGVVNQPTGFRHSGGLGVMGEAGPEAIMPLKRGPDGKLGVVAQGSGTVVNNVTVNVQGGNGTPQEIGNAAANGVTRALRGLVTQTVQDQHRPGNVFNPAPIQGFA